jgi:dTDP-4-dehydrorhamnose 3,5-epimerase-like enzyme
MKIIKTKIKDLLILKSQIFKDKRGSLRETYRKDILNNNFPFDITRSVLYSYNSSLISCSFTLGIEIVSDTITSFCPL